MGMPGTGSAVTCRKLVCASCRCQNVSSQPMRRTTVNGGETPKHVPRLMNAKRLAVTRAPPGLRLRVMACMEGFRSRLLRRLRRSSLRRSGTRWATEPSSAGVDHFRGLRWAYQTIIEIAFIWKNSSA